MTPLATSASVSSTSAFSGGPSNSSFSSYGNFLFDRFGSPRPTSVRSPPSTPSLEIVPRVSSVVWKRYSGPSFASARAVVNSFMFEAGTKYLSAFCSYNVLPLSASTISSPHSPLFVGVVPSNASMRAANLAVAFLEAALCFFAPQQTGAAVAFDCAPRGCAPIPTVHAALATATAAHRCRIFSILIFHSRRKSFSEKYSRKARQSVVGASHLWNRPLLQGSFRDPVSKPKVAPGLPALYDGSSPENYHEVNSD